MAVDLIAALGASVTTLVLCTGLAGAEPGYSPVRFLPVPAGESASGARYDTISCASTTSCTGVGVTAAGVPFAATQTDGVWGAPTTFALPAGDAATRLNVTCVAVGSCLAAGSYVTPAGASVPVLVEETAGTWGAVTAVIPPTAGSSATMLRPWCASPGNCEALGVYETAGSSQLMTATETAGVWGPTSAISNGSVASAVPVIEAQGYFAGAAFTCTSAGSCVAVSDTATWTETAGSWSAAMSLPAPTPLFGGSATFGLTSVACATPTTCLAVGSIEYSWCSCRPGWNAAVAVDTSGAWSAPVSEEGGLSGFNGISCAASQCVAVGDTGSYVDSDSYDDPLAATWSDGTWSGNVEPIPVSASTNTEASSLSDVSCSSSTQCVAIGEDGEFVNQDGPFGVSPYATTLTPVSTAVAPGAPRVVDASPVPGGVVVSWDPSQDDGGAPVSTYSASPQVGLDGGPDVCTTATTSCLITGLVNGHQYVVTVTANNGTGTSARTWSNHFFAGAVPTAPTALRAAESRHEIAVRWDSSTTPSGEGVLRYEVVATGAGQTVTRLATAWSVTTTLKGLRSHHRYRLAIEALDVTGWSPGGVLTVTTR